MVSPYSPAYRIVADGADITEVLLHHNASITVNDCAGWQSDSLTISLTSDGLKLPSTGAELRVWMGYADELRLLGLFVVDQLSLPIPATSLSIKALGAPFEKSARFKALQTRRSRSWSPMTIQELVISLAAEHGLEASVAAEFRNSKLDHLDQVDESDMHLLTRIAADNDAIAKANGGHLLFVPRAAAQSASGKAMPTVTLTPKEVTEGKVRLSKRQNFQTVIARWRDMDAAKDEEVKAGTGEPVYRIRKAFPSQESAQKAAQGRLKGFQRGQSTLSLTLPGRPELVAESRVILSGFRDGIDGDWSVTQVTHSLTPRQGFTTSLQAEVPQ